MMQRWDLHATNGDGYEPRLVLTSLRKVALTPVACTGHLRVFSSALYI